MLIHQAAHTGIELLRGRYGDFLVRELDAREGDAPSHGRAPDVELLSAHLRVQSTVIDIGAGIGGFAIPVAHMVGPEGAVFCFEDRPDQHELLECNVALNGVERTVTVAHLARQPSDAPSGERNEGSDDNAGWVESADFDELVGGEGDSVDLIKLEIGFVPNSAIGKVLRAIEKGSEPLIYLAMPAADPEGVANLVEALLVRLNQLGYGFVAGGGGWNTPQHHGKGAPESMSDCLAAIERSRGTEAGAVTDLLAIPAGGRRQLVADSGSQPAIADLASPEPAEPAAFEHNGRIDQPALEDSWS